MRDRHIGRAIEHDGFRRVILIIPDLNKKMDGWTGIRIMLSDDRR